MEKEMEVNPHKNKVHKVLAHSYIFHFVVFLVAFALDFIFPLKIFTRFFPSMGFILLIVGTFVIFWAQMSSHKLKKENMNCETFCSGPYRYLRCPTNLGIFLVMFGFGIAMNSLFVSVFALASFFISKFTFIKKEEKILSDRYGEPYLEYKKSVKF